MSVFRRERTPLTPREAAWRAFMRWLRVTSPVAFMPAGEADFDGVVTVRVLPFPEGVES